MKSLLYNFLVALLVLIAALLKSCQSSSDKLEEANREVAKVQEDLKQTKVEAQAFAIEVSTEEEWRMFKTESEIKIKNNEIHIDE